MAKFSERRPQMFPRLTDVQIARISRLGERRKMTAGQVLFAQGGQHPDFYVLLSGEIEAVQVQDGVEVPIAVQVAGEFTGELNLLSGRRGLVTGRMRTDGEVLAISPEALRSIVQSDSELSEILMRAFILRRVALLDTHGDTVLIGSTYCAATLRIREFLTRNAHPHLYLDLDKDASVQALFDRFGLTPNDIPVLICRWDKVLRRPSNEEVADCLGLSTTLDASTVYDLVVVGAGPAGLAAAVYGASEGLNVVALETNAPGGQAGSSSKIENYLGFPTGISGMALAGRAYTQAQKFGAEVAVASSAAALHCDRRPYEVELSGGAFLRARAVVVATGAEYRKLPLAELSRYEGVGVYYTAMHLEAQLCQDERVIVVGGGNSAGQAAVYLAGFAEHVDMVVRGRGLAETMSRYLIRRIEDNPKITLRPYTEIVELSGGTSLEQVRLRDNRTGADETLPMRHVFLMTGASPNTKWLRGCLALDDKGFVKTGQDLTRDDLSAWPLSRPPFLLETSRPGIFAVGDVRANSVKRVASAVGEGSICVQLVHRALAE